MNTLDQSIPRPIEERRAFGLHPKILLTIMREQAGSLAKAMAELVMNSVDAGATRIDLTVGESTFELSDDGCGFSSRDQLENFFDNLAKSDHGHHHHQTEKEEDTSHNGRNKETH